MLPSFATRPVNVVHPVWVTDTRNTRRATYPPDAPRVAVPGCWLNPGNSSELNDARSTTEISWTLYAPPGADIGAADQVEVDGVMHLVDGEPQRVPSPTGAVSHVLALLVRWKG